jgi:hypothetical protein
MWARVSYMTYALMHSSGPPNRREGRWRPRQLSSTPSDVQLYPAYSDAMAEDEELATAGDDTFARWLRRARVEAGWGKLQAVEALAEVGIKERAYFRWESGEISKPDPRQVRKACLRLKLDTREAAIALGIVTRDELDLPAPAPMEPVLADAARMLASDDIPQPSKENLRFLIEKTIGFTYATLGLRQPPMAAAELAADDRVQRPTRR